MLTFHNAPSFAIANCNRPNTKQLVSMTGVTRPPVSSIREMETTPTADNLTDYSLYADMSKGVRRILVRGSMPPCRLRRRKFDYEMMHSEVYLNKYVVSTETNRKL